MNNLGNSNNLSSSKDNRQKNRGLDQSGNSICNIGVGSSTEANKRGKNTSSGETHKIGMSKSNANLSVNDSKYLSKYQLVALYMS